ncbi:hypothetical protein GCM10010336_61820 [Streptomyces goshikiensis]|nr:hypothetical protein GCM10010336_61820 [Streptomyces goshikiensis]
MAKAVLVMAFAAALPMTEPGVAADSDQHDHGRGGLKVTGLTGTAFGVDFNPTADRLRIISDTCQNLRHNVNVATGGTLADTPRHHTPATTPTAGVSGAAYTDNDLDAATATSLFDIDTASYRVALQSPANSGTLAPIGNLGVDAKNQRWLRHLLLAQGRKQPGLRRALHRRLLPLLHGQPAHRGGPRRRRLPRRPAGLRCRPAPGPGVAASPTPHRRLRGPGLGCPGGSKGGWPSHRPAITLRRAGFPRTPLPSEGDTRD